MKDVMIDLETLGKNKNAPIASIGAVFFEPETGELGEKFYCRVDFENDMKNGAIPDGGTIKWWLKQSPEARAELVSDDAIPIWDAVNKFSDWLTDNADDLNIVNIWASSPSFDCVILSAAFERAETDIPWKYWNECDVRTMKFIGRLLGVDLRLFTGTVAHHALSDAVNQAGLVSAVLRALAIPSTAASMVPDGIARELMVRGVDRLGAYIVSMGYPYDDDWAMLAKCVDSFIKQTRPVTPEGGAQ
ncbi:3'-5' exonuclease [Dickeya solani]|uniref:3'-5' exonuclease n=1 Tax=Dickeya solani TaxID=1089444 RepID=A0AAX4F3X1_9GAMM|nr:3'-5' exonuclease [Dickeya solani]WOA54353.1 3'-5' exonuclease [Dickeya solani]